MEPGPAAAAGDAASKVEVCGLEQAFRKLDVGAFADDAGSLHEPGDGGGSVPVVSLKAGIEIGKLGFDPDFAAHVGLWARRRRRLARDVSNRAEVGMKIGS
jgi:hypothetical protein